LRYPAVDPTNNRAERQLHPAVIARKGVDTWQILPTLIVTNTQNGFNNIDYFRKKAAFTFS
jgi:hypothetical protein